MRGGIITQICYLDTVEKDAVQYPKHPVFTEHELMEIRDCLIKPVAERYNQDYKHREMYGSALANIRARRKIDRYFNAFPD